MKSSEKSLPFVTPWQCVTYLGKSTHRGPRVKLHQNPSSGYEKDFQIRRCTKICGQSTTWNFLVMFVVIRFSSKDIAYSVLVAAIAVLGIKYMYHLSTQNPSKSGDKSDKIYVSFHLYRNFSLFIRRLSVGLSAWSLAWALTTLYYTCKTNFLKKRASADHINKFLPTLHKHILEQIVDKQVIIIYCPDRKRRAIVQQITCRIEVPTFSRFFHNFFRRKARYSPAKYFVEYFSIRLCSNIAHNGNCRRFLSFVQHSTLLTTTSHVCRAFASLTLLFSGF